MKLKNLITTLLCAVLTCIGTISLAQTTVSGKVMDTELNEGLIGANVIIAGTSEGASTDIDGNFSITSSTPLPWTLEVSYAGYADQSIVVESAMSDMMINMVTTALLGEEVVISASRRREKIQEAPASISVLTARKLEGSPNDNPARSLVNLPGVTVQQQSAGRINIQLRGDGGLFGSATFPILDYRSLSGPGLGTFDALNSALNNVDLERIEVVRGPGSALYGPGVTSGVVHFISKSPIDRPGTTIELVGGELNTFGVSARHATKVSDKFGFKINAVYKKGDEFTLDASDPTDAAQIAKFATTIVAPGITNGTVDPTAPTTTLLTQAELDPDGDGNMMQDFWEQQVLTATLEFRPSDQTSVNIAGGINSASAVFYNSQGEGLSQANEFWTQARVQSGGLFAQLFYLDNDGGKPDKPTFLYQTGSSTRISRGQFEGQVQYNWDMADFLNSNWTGGVDYRSATSNTFNQVYGREEEDDDFSIIGAYLQTKLALSPKLDLVVAGRYDKFNFLDDGAFQPRAVMVYKPSPTQTFRFGYNQAVGAPTALQVNIDFPVSVPVPGAFDIWLKGNKTAQTFDNAVIKLNGLLGGIELPIGTPGLPNAIVYGGVLEGVLAQLTPGIEAATGSAALAGAIDNYLRTNSVGGVTGSLNGVNIFTGQPLGLIEAPAASLRTEDTWEFGYKGLIGGKLGATLDIYHKKIDGATLFTGISPSYGMTAADLGNIGTDLGAAVATQDLRNFIFAAVGGAANPAAGATADALVATIGGAFTGGGNAFATSITPLALGNILGATPTDQLPTDGVTHSAAGYRTFEAFEYTGADLGLEYYASEDISIFFNYSMISENEFNPRIKGTDGSAMTSISQPKNKWRAGFTYAPIEGFRANMAFQHDPSYQVFLGQFSGLTEERNLVDAAAGYKWDNGLSIDLTAQNLFNQEYRYFPGFPKIGRRVLAKLTYSFGENP